MQNRFAEYYCKEVKKQLDSGKQLDEIEIDFRLTVLKPLHAQWLIALYNHFTSDNGEPAIIKSWKKSAISGVLDKSTVLPPHDPFIEFDN